MSMRWVASALVAAVVAAAVANAGDGVIEINQANATAGGVTPSDTPGFPVEINQPGSYRLTGNLVAPLGAGAVLIQATNVTLDLGGFRISSTNVCSGYPTTSCTDFGGPEGIQATSAWFLVTVRNGSVTGFAGSCVELMGASSVVEDVRVLGCGNSGISLGAAGRVSRSFAGGNREDGIRLSEGASVDANEVRANGHDGINISTSGAGLGGYVAGNRAFQNGSAGIVATGSSLLSRNVVVGNVGASIVLWLPAKSLLENICDGSFC